MHRYGTRRMLKMYYMDLILFISFIDTCSRLASTECVPCNCDKEGSVSLSCDSKGQCRCKDKYYGTKCSNRDCEMTAWSSWTNCRCGHADQKTRTRSVKEGKVGEGLPCFRTKETGTCTIVPCDCARINPGYYGDLCQNRDCHLSQWSSFTICPTKCARQRILGKVDRPTRYPRKTRRRSVQIEKAGNGKSCSSRLSDSDSCGYKCVNRCGGIPYTCWYQTV